MKELMNEYHNTVKTIHQNANKRDYLIEAQHLDDKLGKYLEDTYEIGIDDLFINDDGIYITAMIPYNIVFQICQDFDLQVDKYTKWEVELKFKL